MEYISARHKKGFTLFIAIVISSAVLVGSYAISNVVYNQIRISGDQKESLRAFVAADNGLECALYYDDLLVRNAFSTSTQFDRSIECAHNTISNGDAISSLSSSNGTVLLGGEGWGSENIFQLDFNDTGTCAVVTVTKNQEGNPGEEYEKTVIVSKGYNTCDSERVRRLERALRLTY